MVSVARSITPLRIIRDEEAPAYDGQRGPATGRFAMIPEQVFLLNDGAALAVYAILANHANKDGECWPSMKALESALGWTETRIRPALKKLCDEGIVSVEKRKLHGMDKSNIYRLHANVRVPHDKVAVPHSEVMGTSLQGVRSLTTRDEQEPIELKPIELDTPPKPPKGYSAEFEERFWAHYPKGRGSKTEAFKLWQKLESPEKAQAAESLATFKAGSDWQRGFHPAPEVWLRGRRWENPPATTNGRNGSTDWNDPGQVEAYRQQAEREMLSRL